MIKEKSFIAKICDHVIKISIYALVFLTPLLFAPWSSDVLDFNKQALLILMAFIALFAWMLKVLINGAFAINTHKSNIAVASVLLVYVVSTIFSVFRYGSFWGWPQVTSASLISIIGLCILYFLVSNSFSKKEISTSFLLFTWSSALALLYGATQLFGIHIIPFNFAKSNSFNTIGTTMGSMGVFAVSLLPLFIVFSINAKKWAKAIFLVNVSLVFIVLLLVNYNFIWILALLGSGFIVFLWFVRRDAFDGRWMFLPMFFIVISLFFIIVRPQVGWLPAKPLEVSLSQKMSFEIGAKTLQSSPLRAIIGSGPGTFVYDFAKYKDKDFNKGSFWNISFNMGTSKFLSDLATVGALGLLALLSLAVVPLFYGVKYFFTEKFTQSKISVKDADGQDESVADGDAVANSPYSKNDLKSRILSMGSLTVGNMSIILALLAVLLVQTIGYFLNNSNVSLDVVYFFCIAALVGLISKSMSGSKQDVKKYILKPSSVLTLATTFVFTIIFIFGLGFLVLGGQRYMADVYYYKGLYVFSKGQKDEGIKYLKKAASTNTGLDLYFTKLSLFSLSKLQDVFSGVRLSELKEEDKKNIQSLVSDAIGAVNIATKIDPDNIDNWSTRGYACQNLFGLVGDSVDCAIQSYDKAIHLSPNNPYLLVQQGNVYMIQAFNLSEEEAGNKGDILAKAKEKFSRAIALKENYALAYLQMALLAKLQQNDGEKAKALQNAIAYSANDAGMAFQIGLIYYQEKDWNKAQEQFQRAVSMIPNYANALYYAGVTYDQQGKKEEALSMFSKILQLNPENQALKNIVDNLKNGKKALEGLAQQPSEPDLSSANPPFPNSTSTNPPANQTTPPAENLSTIPAAEKKK